MATRGAQKGNNNAAKGKEYQLALRKALARMHGTSSKGLERIARQLIQAAEEGEGWALKEIADRFDGKPAQQQILTGDPDNPVSITEVRRSIVDPKTPNS